MPPSYVNTLFAKAMPRRLPLSLSPMVMALSQYN
jgi:hypothetical protein